MRSTYPRGLVGHVADNHEVEIPWVVLPCEVEALGRAVPVEKVVVAGMSVVVECHLPVRTAAVLRGSDHFVALNVQHDQHLMLFTESEVMWPKHSSSHE